MLSEQNLPRPEIRISFEKIIRTIDRIGQIISIKLFKFKPEEISSAVADWDSNKFKLKIDRRRFITYLGIGTALTSVALLNKEDFLYIITKPKESAVNIFKNETVNFPAVRFFEKYKFCDIQALSAKIYDKFYSRIIPNIIIAKELILEPISRVTETYYYLATDVAESDKTPDKFTVHAFNFHQRIFDFTKKYNLNLFTHLSILDKAGWASTDKERVTTFEIYYQELQERFIQIKLRRFSLLNPLIAAEATNLMVSQRISVNLRNYDGPRVIQPETTLGNDVENELYSLAIQELDDNDKLKIPVRFRDKFDELLHDRKALETSRSSLEVASNTLANLLQNVFDKNLESTTLKKFLNTLGIYENVDKCSSWQRVSYTEIYQKLISKESVDKFYEKDGKFQTRKFFSEQIKHPYFFEALSKFISETKSATPELSSMIMISRGRFENFKSKQLKYIQTDEYIAYNVIPIMEKSIVQSEILLQAYPLYLQKKAFEYIYEIFPDVNLTSDILTNPKNNLVTTLCGLIREISPVNVLLEGKFAMNSITEMPYNNEKMFEYLTPIIREIYQKNSTKADNLVDIFARVGQELSTCFFVEVNGEKLDYSELVNNNIRFLTIGDSATLHSAIRMNFEQFQAMQ